MADPYAVASRYQTSCYVPRQISAACNLFIQKGVLLYAKLLAHDVSYSSDMPPGR